MSYLRQLLGTMLLLLAVVVAMNLAVDPGRVFRSEKVDPNAYCDVLINSKHALWWPESSYDDRSLKKTLAMHSHRFECVVIGSSHVMQVSSQRANSSLGQECGSLLNLGVSGGGIEDHITLAYLALSNGRPKKIVLGADPWLLAFGKDERWTKYAADYYRASEAILGENGQNEPEHANVFRNKIGNLFSLEYTVRSLRTGLDDFLRRDSSRNAVVAALKLDETIGGRDPALLSDGSVIYSAKFVAEARTQRVPVGGTTYKTDGELNQDAAINAYRSLLLWIKRQGVEPILLLTPYHENVWQSPNSSNARALLAAEPIFHSLARELKIKLIGSYDPRVMGCLPSEFYDFMHPTAACLAKIR